MGRDRARRLGRRPELTASAAGAEWEEASDGCEARHPEATAMREGLAEAVRAAVRALPEKERAALLLREYQQLSYVEISAALRTSLPAVKMLLHRARGRLRLRLEAGPVREMLEVLP